MDITTDGFGFMLNIGDLAWVPFSYTLQARYLAFHPVQLGAFWTTLTLVAQLTGYYIFRTANGEKNDFRNGKNPKSQLDESGSFAWGVELITNLFRRSQIHRNQAWN
jgi:delta14-sterol reductase